MAIVLGLCCIVTAFSEKAVGTKVTDAKAFLEAVPALVEGHDASGDRQPGQHYIPCPSLVPYVSAGVGHRTDSPDDYVLRNYGGRVTTFLKREKAAVAESVALVVYTREAYLADPDTMKDAEETARILASDYTHVLVAVLAFAGPKAPLSPYRLVANLGGANNEALKWEADEIRAKAAESIAYWNEWEVVAD